MALKDMPAADCRLHERVALCIGVKDGFPPLRSGWDALTPGHVWQGSFVWQAAVKRERCAEDRSRRLLFDLKCVCMGNIPAEGWMQGGKYRDIGDRSCRCLAPQFSDLGVRFSFGWRAMVLWKERDGKARWRRRQGFEAEHRNGTTGGSLFGIHGRAFLPKNIVH